MAKNIRPDAAACGPALITILVATTDADQTVVFKSIQNMDTVAGNVKLRNAKDDSDVIITLPAWGRIDGYYSRVYTTLTTITANKIIGFYDTP